MRVSDCVAVVTGGASGLGEACVRELAGAGRRWPSSTSTCREAKNWRPSSGAYHFCQGGCDERRERPAGDPEGDGGLRRLQRGHQLRRHRRCLQGPHEKGPMPLAEFNRSCRSISWALQRDPPRLGADGQEYPTVRASGASSSTPHRLRPSTARSASRLQRIEGRCRGMTLPLARECADYGVRVMTIAPVCSIRPCWHSCPKPSGRPWERWCLFPRGWDGPKSTPCSPGTSSRTPCSTAR